MANKRRFKPSRTAIGFRQRGEGLGAAVTRLREQANIEIQGLKDIQTQTQAQAKDYLNSLSDKYQNEADVRRIHHELEDQVDKNIIESARVRADQEIKDAENEAQRHRTEAEFWRDFSPTLSKNLTKLSTEGFKVADTIRGNALLNEYSATNANALINELGEKESRALKRSMNIALESGNLKAAQAAVLLEKTYNNSQFSNTVVDDIINNKQAWIEKGLSEIQDILTSQGKELTSSNIQVLMNTWTHSLLNRLKVGRNTNAAKRLLREFASVATTKRNNMIYSGRATETQQQIKQQYSIIRNSDSSDEDKQEAYKSIQNIYGITGTFRDDKGKYHQGGYNKAQAFIQFGTFVKDNFRNQFQTIDEYKELLRSIKVSGTNQYMYERHTAHYNKLVEEFTKSYINDDKKRKQVVEAEKSQAVVKMRALFDKLDGNAKTAAEKSEAFTTWMEEVNKLPKNQRDEVLKQVRGFDKEHITVIEPLITIQEYLSEKHPDFSAIKQVLAYTAKHNPKHYDTLTDILSEDARFLALRSGKPIDIKQVMKNVDSLLKNEIKTDVWSSIFNRNNQLNTPEYDRVKEELIADYLEVLHRNLSQYGKDKPTPEQVQQAEKEAWDYVITSFNNGHPDQEQKNPELYNASKYKRIQTSSEDDKSFRFTTFDDIGHSQHQKGWVGSNLAALNLKGYTHEMDDSNFNLFTETLGKVDVDKRQQVVKEVFSSPNLLSKDDIKALKDWDARKEAIYKKFLDEHPTEETRTSIIQGKPPANVDKNREIFNGLRELPPLPPRIKKLLEIADGDFGLLDTLAENLELKHSLYLPTGKANTDYLNPKCDVKDNSNPGDIIGVAAYCVVNSRGVVPRSKSITESTSQALEAFGIPTTGPINIKQISTAIDEGVLYRLNREQSGQFIKYYGSVFSQAGIDTEDKPTNRIFWR